MAEDETPQRPSQFLPPGLGVPGAQATAPPPLPPPGSAAPRSPSPPAVYASDDGSVAAGIGALLAAAGLFGYQFYVAIHGGRDGFFVVSPVWWSSFWAVNMLVALLLAVCGLALVVRAGDWAAALMLPSAAMVFVLLATSAGSLAKTGVSYLAAGTWAAVIGALGCLLAIVMGTRQLALGSWASDGDVRSRGPATAIVAGAGILAIVSLFASRAIYRAGFLNVTLKSLFSDLHGSWSWALALGVLFVTVVVVAVAIMLGDAPRSGWFVLGIAPAVLVWAGDSVSSIVLRKNGYHPATGFWMLVIAAGLFVVAGILQIADSH